MSLPPDYFIKRAEEIEAALPGVNDPALRKAYDGLSRALRAMAEMVRESRDKGDPPKKNSDRGLPRRH